MNDLAHTPSLNADIVHSLVLDGDLSRLTPAQRVDYYVHRCSALGIDPGEQPFQLIRLNGKLALYATKTCANALTRVNRLSVEIKSTRIEGSLIIVEARASDPSGRFCDDVGVLDLTEEKLSKPNALMKCATKAKRRAVLALVGLGVLDETEVEDIRGAQRLALDVETGSIDAEVVEPVLGPRCSGAASGIAEANTRRIAELAEIKGYSLDKTWDGAVKQARINVAKYGRELDGRSPFVLTVDDGMKLRQWCDATIDKLRPVDAKGEARTAKPSKAARHMDNVRAGEDAIRGDQGFFQEGEDPAHDHS